MDLHELNSLYSRLVSGDPTASADLIECLYGPLIGHAIKKHGKFGMDRDRAADLALDVLVSLIEHPNQYDPSKGNIFGYLCMAIDGDAINRGRDLGNRKQIFSAYVVEVQEIGGNTYETSPETRIDAMGILDKHLNEIVSEEGDMEVLRLILQEEREYEVYAAALQLTTRSADERAKEVKRRKDRIEKRLKRLKEKL